MTASASESTKLGMFATFVVRKLWTLFAIALVLVALLMSLLRYSLPFLNDHKAYLEEYIFSHYALDLSVGELSATWQSHGPAIVLRKVEIKNSRQSPVTLSIGEVFLDLDFWPSIAQRKIQSSQVTLDNLELTVDLTRMEASKDELPILNALENIFLEQLSNFIVSNSRVTLVSRENNKTIEIAQLSWLNKNKRHQGVGEFVLADVSDNTASFILDLYGDVDSYSGTLFAQAQDINLSPWINEYTGLQSQLVSSKGNIEVWARIENGELKRIDGQVLPTTFRWTNDESDLRTAVSANFAAIKGPKQWDFSVSDLQIDTQGDVFTTNVVGYFTPQGDTVLQVPAPVSIKPLLSLSRILSPSVADTLATIDANATVSKLSMLLGEKGLTVQSTINDIRWQEHQKVVGLEGAQANLYWQGKRGKLVLFANNATLYSEHFFARALPIHALNVPILFDFSDDTTKATNISINDALVELDGLKFGFDTQYATTKRFLSLVVDIDPFSVGKVPSLLPKHLVGEGTTRFLTNAFMGEGQVTQANLLFHGAIDGFPFANNAGVFQSNVSVAQADFSFSNGWPALSKLDIDLFFENNALTMTSPSSMLDKVRLSNLQANIPDLNANAMLTITADGAATSSDITGLMLQSSLAESLGQLLNKDVLVEGDLTTKLNLFIPLDNGAKTRVTGDVYLRNNSVLIPAINLAFSNTKGKVSFDNETITISGMQALLMAQKVNIGIQGKQLQDKYLLNANIDGNWASASLAQSVSEPFSRYFSGSARWGLDVELELMADNFNYQATLRSNLIGLEANVPAPLGKEAMQRLPLTLIASGDRTASSVEMTLGDVARFDGALAHKEKQFNRAHLALGPTELESRGLGFSISGDFEHVIVEDWYPFIGAITLGIDTSQTHLLGVPKRIFIDTEQLTVAGESFSDVDVIAKRVDDHWTFDIDANELRGNVSLFDERFSKGVVINAEYIRIAKGDARAISTQINPYFDQFEMDPKTLPRINFTCKACDIKGINLGRIALEAQPNSDGLKITQLMVNNEFGNVITTGQWYQRNQDHYTFLAGDINSSNFGEFVSQLGIDSGIKDSSATVKFALTWQDAPMDISLKDLNGQIEWQLSDGYLADVSDQGSRIFTLLSLNSLVRKLSLDFRDVFAKGFFYDNMRGSVQIADGIADTRDTLIDGAAGEIEIYGNTDLSKQTLNYNVSFTPNVTGNLPVLVYFFTVSPPTALAALAIDQVLTSAKVISNINYSVTGTIKEPILIETGRENTEVDLPARRDVLPSDDLPPFVPPTKDDFIQIEAQGRRTG